MARILGFLLVDLLFVSALWAQPDTLWTRTYGGPGNDIAVSIVPASDGGYLLFGRIATCDTCVSLTKIDSTGSIEWTREQAVSNPSRPVAMIRTNEGGLVCVIRASSHPNAGLSAPEDVTITRLTAVFDTAWTRTLYAPWAPSGYPRCQFKIEGIAATDYGFVLAGTRNSDGVGDLTLNCGLAIGISASGDSLWTYIDECTDIAIHTRYFAITAIPDTASDVLVVGYHGYPWTDGHDAWYVNETMLRRFGQTGNHATLGGVTGMGGFALVAMQADRMAYLCGASASTTNLVVCTATHTVLNNQTLSGQLAALIPFGGGLLATGTDPAGSSDLLLEGTDQFGGLRFTRTWGGAAAESGVTLAPTPDGGCIILGTTTSFGAGGTDAYVIKVGPIGPLAVEPAPSSTLPEDYALTAFPNPFNGTASIRYTLSAPANVTVDVYNTLGQRVLALADGPQTAGSHALQVSSASLASGVYFVSLSIHGNRHLTKLLCLK